MAKNKLVSATFPRTNIPNIFWGGDTQNTQKFSMHV